VNPHATTQISVPLMLSRNESHRCSPVPACHMTHSVSTPMLHAAWSMRSLEHAVPPIDTSCYAGIFAHVTAATWLVTISELEKFSEYFCC